MPIRKFEDSLPLQLLKAREASMLLFRPVLNNNGLTEQQWRVLRALYDYKELEPKELAQRCCLLSPSLTGILNRLHQQGYIKKRKSVKDQRCTIVSLTEKSDQIFQKLSIEIESRYNKFASYYGEKNLDSLMEMLKDLSELDISQLT